MSITKIKNNIGIFIFTILVISTFATGGILSELDEIAAGCSFLILIFSFLNSSLKKKISKIFLMTLLFIIFGLVSNVTSGIHRSVFDVTVDVLTVGKPFWIFLAMIHLVSPNTFGWLRIKLSLIIKIFILILFIFLFFNTLHIVQMGNTFLFSHIPNFSFTFGFPVPFAIVLYGCIGFLLKNDIKIMRQPWILSLIFLIITTGKMQSYIFVIIFFGLLSIRTYRERNLKISRLILVGILGALISLPKLMNYFATTAYSPRKLLMIDGFNLLLSHLPFGTGFATFGSTMASKDYSPLYYQLGYEYNYGLQPIAIETTQSFLNDNWGASLIGQFGIVGIIIFICVIFYIYKLFTTKLKSKNIDIYIISGFTAVLSIIFSSSFFTSSSGGLLMAILAIIFVSRVNYLQIEKN